LVGWLRALKNLFKNKISKTNPLGFQVFLKRLSKGGPPKMCLAGKKKDSRVPNPQIFSPNYFGG